MKKVYLHVQLRQDVTNGVDITLWQTILTESLRTCLASIRQTGHRFRPEITSEFPGRTGTASHRIARCSDCILRNCADYKESMGVSSAAPV